MELKDISIKPFELFDKDHALVTAGDENKFNTMTVSWGTMGTLWNKPVVIVFVKPIRYTYEFLMAKDYFTVSFFDKAYLKDLAYLGSVSGKDEDKLAKTSLHPVFLENGVTFKEAGQTFVLKKIYASQFVKENVPEFAHEKYYLDEEEHYIFIGEVTEVCE